MRNMSATPVSITGGSPAGPDRRAVEAVIEYMRPALQMDGGDLRLVAVHEDGTVEISFAGACVGCPISALTLQAGVERVMFDRVPGVTRVVAVD